MKVATACDIFSSLVQKTIERVAIIIYVVCSQKNIQLDFIGNLAFKMVYVLTNSLKRQF